MNMMEIQKALKNAGFDPGPIDGVTGRVTLSAIKAFQESKGLVVDGIVGPKTAAALFPDGVPKAEAFAIPTSMAWLLEAHHLLGTQEQSGRGSNGVIIDWAKDLELMDYTSDDIPWCGLFVAHCIGSQLPEEALPTKPLLARSWKKFGTETTPVFGAVMVFWRESPRGSLGHVGFYWAEDVAAYHVLGGNQSDSVTFTRVAKNRLLGARWPGTAMAPTVGSRRAEAGGKVLSENEA